MARPRKQGKDIRFPGSPPASASSREEGVDAARGAAERLLSVTTRLAEALAQPAQLTRLYQTIVSEFGVLLGASAVALCEPAADDDTLRVCFGTAQLAALEGALLPVHGSFTGLSVETGSPQRAEDLAAEDVVYDAELRAAGTGPALAIALESEARAVGALLAQRDASQEPFSEHDEEAANEFAKLAAAMLENARRFDESRASESQLAAWRRCAELERWQKRYEELAASDRKVVFEWEPEADAFLWGGSLTAVFGYSRGEFGASLDLWAVHLHAEDRETVARTFRQSADEDEPFRIECRLRHASGGYRRVVVRAGAPVAEGGRLAVVGAIDDLAARERQARSEVTVQLVRALRHEINNPLAVVMGQAQLLQTEPVVKGDPLLRQSVSAIFEESARMEALIRRLAAWETAPPEGPIIGADGELLLPWEEEKEE